MAKGLSITNRATVIETVEGIMSVGQYAGKKVKMELWQDAVGLRVNRLEYVRFISLTVDGKKRSYRYSGKNFDKAQQQIDELRPYVN